MKEDNKIKMEIFTELLGYRSSEGKEQWTLEPA